MEDVPFHLSKSVASIACYPQGYCDPSIPIALLSLGLPADRFVRYVHRENPVDCAYNKAVKEALAKPSWKDIEWFVFGDNDMQLTSTDIVPWLAAEGDVVGIMYDLDEQNRTWGQPDAFHAGLWRGRRHVLERIGPPWFKTILTDDGCSIEICCCEYFGRKVRKAGYQLNRAGWAGHGSLGNRS